MDVSSHVLDEHFGVFMSDHIAELHELVFEQQGVTLLLLGLFGQNLMLNFFTYEVFEHILKLESLRGFV